MTSKALKSKKRSARLTIMPIICLAITLLMLVFSGPIEEAVIRGINLAALRIIPTLFPFMVLSDLWVSSVGADNDNFLFKSISRLLGISRESTISLLIGIFCGFPLGVKSAASLYENKIISQDELSHLAPLINLPSLAFVVSGVGAGIYKSAFIGILLYFSTLTASIFISSFNRSKKKSVQNMGFIPRQNFNLVESIKKAGMSSVIVASYIIFFSAVIGLVSAMSGSPLFSTLLSTVFEVGNSVSLIGAFEFPIYIKLPLTAFALGFSGLSVHFQAFVFLPEEVSRKDYLIKKLLIGLLSAIIMLPFVLFQN